MWNIESSARVGCERYRFNGHVTTLLAEPATPGGGVTLSVDSDGDFELNVRYHQKKVNFNVRKGQNRLVIP